MVEKSETLTLYTRALITPGRTRKILIGEGSFCYILTKIFILDIIDIMRTALIINDLRNGFQR